MIKKKKSLNNQQLTKYIGLPASILPLRLKEMEFQERTKRSDSVMGSMENLLKANINSIALLFFFLFFKQVEYKY